LEHSEREDRWMTLGISSLGRLLILCHTFQEISDEQCRIRIISSRKATRKEAKQYAE
jgi:uncharacterized DUF497 family protein